MYYIHTVGRGRESKGRVSLQYVLACMEKNVNPQLGHFVIIGNCGYTISYII